MVRRCASRSALTSSRAADTPDFCLSDNSARTQHTQAGAAVRQAHTHGRSWSGRPAHTPHTAQAGTVVGCTHHTQHRQAQQPGEHTQGVGQLCAPQRQAGRQAHARLLLARQCGWMGEQGSSTKPPPPQSVTQQVPPPTHTQSVTPTNSQRVTPTNSQTVTPTHSQSVTHTHTKCDPHALSKCDPPTHKV